MPLTEFVMYGVWPAPVSAHGRPNSGLPYSTQATYRAKSSVVCSCNCMAIMVEYIELQ